MTEYLQTSLGPLQMPMATAIEKQPETPPALDVVPLLFTSDQSWTIDRAQYAQMVETKKFALPAETQVQKLALGMAIGPKAGVQLVGDAQQALPKIVIFGDSDFLTDAQAGSAQLTLAYMAVTWLTGDADVGIVAPADEKSQPIDLENKQSMIISICSVVVIPFFIFFSGLAYTTIRRRKR